MPLEPGNAEAARPNYKSAATYDNSSENLYSSTFNIRTLFTCLNLAQHYNIIHKSHDSYDNYCDQIQTRCT